MKGLSGVNTRNCQLILLDEIISVKLRQSKDGEIGITPDYEFGILGSSPNLC